MEQFTTHILSEYGITAGLYILIVLSFMYYVPRIVNRHFDAIDKLNEKNNQVHEKMLKDYKESLNQISSNFEKWVNNSMNWHTEHNKKLEQIKSDIYEIKTRIK